MGFNYGSSIVRDGLICYYDFANKKSFDYSTNLFPYSEDFTQSVWVKANDEVVVTSDRNLQDPFGGTNASRIYANTGPYTTMQDGVTVVQGDTYTMSLYAKYVDQRYITLVQEGTDSSSVTFDFQTETVSGSGSEYVSSRATDVGNGWWRIENTFVNTSDTSAVVLIWFGLYSGINYSNTSIDIFGAQIERREIAGPYVRTTGSIVTEPTSVTDISGNGVNATLNNVDDNTDRPHLPTHHPNTGIAFDERRQYISTGTWDFSQLGNITVEILYKRTGTNDYGTGGAGSPSYYQGVFNYYWSGGHQIYVGTTSNASSNNLYVCGITTTLATDQWVHITAVTGPAGREAYINGESIGTASGSNFETNAEHIYLGNWDSSWASFCEINLFRMYDRALSADEVKRNFNAVRGRVGL